MSCVCRTLAPLAVGGAVSVVVTVATGLLLRGARAPRAVNHRGAVVSVVLGWAVFAGVWVGWLAGAVVWLVGSDQALGPVAVPLVLPLIALAGLYDDLQTGPGRGLAGHVRELLRGRVTPGIVKLVAAVVAALVVILATRATGARAALGVVVIAGCANVWNLLDVRPGRCGKAFVVVVVPLLLAADDPVVRLIGWSAMATTVAALPFDLGEREMLGDAGSNLLGLIVGIVAFDALSTIGLAIAAGVVLAIHAVSEWVTLSRVIRAVPPVRWFDDLGRLRPPEPDRRPSPDVGDRER